jgi:dienelactone hydrolase
VLRKIAFALAIAACGDNTAEPADAAADVASAYACNGSTGLVAPLAPCSPARPCGTVTTSFVVPDCQTHTPSMPAFDDNAPRTWNDAVTGDPRAACVFHPTGGGARPLVMFFHGATAIGSQAAPIVYDVTLLRAKATSFDLANDAARLGFVLAADQGEVLDNPNSIGGGGAIRRDIYYRDLASPSSNPDVRNADRLIDELVAEGGIDPHRIYAVGWSNGGLFAQEYAVARHATATPGGNRIAAAVAYAGPDPFENLSTTQTPSCAYVPLPATDLPLEVVHRDCDYPAACDRAQQQAFGTPPGFDLEGWVATLRGPMADPNVVDTLLDAHAQPATACAATELCTTAIGGLNHANWPDGINDTSGVDVELAMLAFLRDHPLP